MALPDIKWTGKFAITGAHDVWLETLNTHIFRQQEDGRLAHEAIRLERRSIPQSNIRFENEKVSRQEHAVFFAKTDDDIATIIHYLSHVSDSADGSFPLCKDGYWTNLPSIQPKKMFVDACYKMACKTFGWVYKPEPTPFGNLLLLAFLHLCYYRLSQGKLVDLGDPELEEFLDIGNEVILGLIWIYRNGISLTHLSQASNLVHGIESRASPYGFITTKYTRTTQLLSTYDVRAFSFPYYKGDGYEFRICMISLNKTKPPPIQSIGFEAEGAFAASGPSALDIAGLRGPLKRGKLGATDLSIHDPPAGESVVILPEV